MCCTYSCSVEAHRLAKKAKKKAQHQHRQAVKKASIDQMLAQMPEDKLKEWREQQEVGGGELQKDVVHMLKPTVHGVDKRA